MGERAEGSTKWPPRAKWCAMAGMCLGLACAFMLCQIRRHTAPALQQFYFWRYVWGSYTGDSFDDLHFGTDKRRPFRVVVVGPPVLTRDGPKYRRATEELLEGAPKSQIFTTTERYVPAEFRQFVRDEIFYGQSLRRWLLWPLAFGGFFTVAFSLIGLRVDLWRLNAAREGRTLRGSVLVSRWKFNRKIKGDGVGIPMSERRNIFELLQGERGRMLRIPIDLEDHHFIWIGGTGAGKSTVNEELIAQILARGERIIVYDTDRTYSKKFGKPNDIWLDPTVDECAYWALEDEAANVIKGTGLAKALWPDEPNQQPFFKKHPRGIFAFLVSRFNKQRAPESPATCRNVAYWLTYPQIEVTKRIKGTNWATSVDQRAKDQSIGLGSTLGEIVPGLQMMPEAEPGRPTFTISEWVRTRPNNIFITSTPDADEALRPLQNMWLDMLILGLMTVGKDPRLPPVWIFLDEPDNLMQLPSLKGGLARLRKSGNTIVLSPGSWSQMEDIYGSKKAETIAGMPFTTMIMRCKEATMAELGAKMLGEAEIERINESRQGGKRHYSTQRLIDPVVMAAELKGLPDLEFYLVHRGLIVNGHIEPTAIKATGMQLTEREIELEPFDPPAELVEQERAAAAAAEAEAAKRKREAERAANPKPRRNGPAPIVIDAGGLLNGISKARREAEAKNAASRAAGYFDDADDGPAPDWRGSVYGTKEEE